MTFDRIEKTISIEDEIISNAKVFKDEPHFQYDIVNSNIPLYIDKLYYPLVMEFPYSPGIDLIFNNDDNFIIAELKHKKYNLEMAQKEAIYHYEKYKKYRIEDLINYGNVNINEANENNIYYLQKKYKKLMIKSIKELMVENKVRIACIVYGKINKDVKNRKCDVIGITYNDKRIVYNIYEKNELAVDYKKESNEYEKIIKSNKKKRKHYNKNEFQKELLNKEMKVIFDYANDNKYIIQRGTGKEISFFIKIKDKQNKYRNIINIYPNLLEVPGNLYNQQYVLGIKEKTIDQYFENIELEFYKNNKYYTDSGTLSIEIDNLNTTIVKNLFRIMNSFRTIIMEV